MSGSVCGFLQHSRNAKHAAMRIIIIRDAIRYMVDFYRAGIYYIRRLHKYAIIYMIALKNHLLTLKNYLLASKNFSFKNKYMMFTYMIPGSKVNIKSIDKALVVI